MNQTHIEHSVIALIIFGIFAWLGFSEAGVAAGTFLFIGREQAQAEDRWISKFGEGKRANMPEWGGFDPRVWDHLDPWMDWVTPMIVTMIAYAMLRFIP